MFTTAVLFFALVTFVNATSILDYSAYPGVNTIRPVVGRRHADLRFPLKRDGSIADGGSTQSAPPRPIMLRSNILDYSAYPGVNTIRPVMGRGHSDLHFPLKRDGPIEESAHTFQPPPPHDGSIMYRSILDYSAYPGVNTIRPIMGRGYVDPDFPSKRDGSIGEGSDTQSAPPRPIMLRDGDELHRRDFSGNPTSPGDDLTSGPGSPQGNSVDLDKFGSKILDGLKSSGLPKEYIDYFSARIQRLKDLSSSAPPSQVRAEANVILLEYGQVLDGADDTDDTDEPADDDTADEPVDDDTSDEPVDDDTTDIESAVQDLVISTVNFLSVIGKSDAADSFMSDVEDMMDKAKNGTIDSNDLLKAASVVIAAMLS